MAEEREREPFEELYRTHRGAVYRFLRRDLGRSEAEDATQTAFAQAYTAYLRGTRPERPRAWLLTIAANLRRRGFRRRRLGAEEVAFEEELTPARGQDERVADLKEALETLPLNQRAALVLREVAGLSYEEIGRSLRLSGGSVQMLLFRARRSMREELAVTSRRGLTLLPSWLTNLLPTAERVTAPLRAAGAAAAIAAAAIVVSGAEPSTGRVPDAPAPALPALQVRTPGREAPARPLVDRVLHAPAAILEPAHEPTPTPAATAPVVPTAGAEPTSAPPAVERPDSIVPAFPALAPLPEPPVQAPALPPLPSLPVEPPALPLPPTNVVEGAP